MVSLPTCDTTIPDNLASHNVTSMFRIERNLRAKLTGACGITPAQPDYYNPTNPKTNPEILSPRTTALKLTNTPRTPRNTTSDPQNNDENLRNSQTKLPNQYQACTHGTPRRPQSTTHVPSTQQYPHLSPTKTNDQPRSAYQPTPHLQTAVEPADVNPAIVHTKPNVRHRQCRS